MSILFSVCTCVRTLNTRTANTDIVQLDQDEPIPREDAVAKILAHRQSTLENRSTRSLTLDRIGGHILAQEIVAEDDRPPRSFATMDGYAIDARDTYPFTIADLDTFPEDEPPPLVEGEAVRIATGAPLPDGANAVLKREDATVDNGQLRGDNIPPGTYTYEQGSNLRAGETLFDIGEPLSPRDALLLGDLGFDTIDVFDPISVGLLATGTEIHEGRMRDLDSPMLAGLVRSWGHEATYAGTVADTYEDVVDRIADLADTHDVVMTTGGTSVGKKDYVIRALDELGTVIFHRVAIRPGKPIALATLPDFDAVALAIPGKPVGAHLVSLLVARPFFTGTTELPTVTADLSRKIEVGVRGFEYAIPVIIDDGTAMPLGHIDSPLSIYQETFDPSVLSSSTRASRADGFFLTRSGVEAGTSIDIIPYHVLE